VFVREGDPADALYIIERGSFEVTVKTPRGETRLGLLEAGEVFGEMGLLRNAPRAATVRVAVDCDTAGWARLAGSGRPHRTLRCIYLWESLRNVPVDE